MSDHKNTPNDDQSNHHQDHTNNDINQQNQKTDNDSENNTQHNNQSSADQTSTDEQTTNHKASSKKSRFAHLGQTAQVLSTAQNRQMLMAGLVIGVVILILFIMLSGGKSPKATKDIHQQHNQDYVAEQNARRLAEMEQQHQHQAEQAETPTWLQPSSTSENKAMVARRNAPTQMYAAGTGGGMDNASNGSHSSANTSTFIGKDAFSQFGNQQAQASTISATKIAHPRYTIAEGEFIHATLETAINSDLPGMVRAVITSPVYTYVGEQPLIPAGSRLIGQYASLSSNGQATTRVFVMWSRIITPAGVSIMINSPGTDGLGRAGMGADSINTHFWKMFGTASLLSIMGASASTSGVSSTDQPNSANMYRQSMAQAFQQAAQNSLNQNMNIKPTLHVYQGDSVNVFVAHDVDLYSVLGSDAQ